MNPLLGIGIVLLALGLLMPAVNVLRHRGYLQAETARKCVHLGMGTLCLSFPWLFHEPWPVWLLAALAVLALGSVRWVPGWRRRVGGVLHDVDRSSCGELYFPLGVAMVFTLARGEVLMFAIPVALLTFADAAGALIGTRWGRHPYVTLEGTKSIEGSLAVGVTGLGVSALPLMLTGHGWLFSLTIGAVVGLFALILEAISWHGLDNIFLPLAAYAQISVYLSTPLSDLAGKLVVLLLITSSALVWRRGQMVDDSARLGAALALYFFWTVGGLPWLVAPVVLLASYVWLMPTSSSGVPRHNLVAVICVGSAGLVWCVAEAFAPDPRWLPLFTLGTATHQAIIAVVRFSQAFPHWNRPAWWSTGVAQAVAAQGLAFWLLRRDQPDALPMIAAGAACVALAAGVFVLIERRLQQPENLSRRWWRQGLTALLASGCGLWVSRL